jgi:putative phosphoesterase
MRLGIISDTHGFFDPQLQRIFAGVQAILHGGDVGGEEILDELRDIAPVHAVAGNVDTDTWHLPPTLTLRFGQWQIEMMHILPVQQSELENWSEAKVPMGRAPKRSQRFLRTFDHSTGVVVFGHSHQPCIAPLGDMLFFNPGSAGKKRFSLPRCCGLLEIQGEGICASIEHLESYNGPCLRGFGWTSRSSLG